jgi:hypothetical protein
MRASKPALSSQYDRQGTGCRSCENAPFIDKTLRYPQDLSSIPSLTAQWGLQLSAMGIMVAYWRVVAGSLRWRRAQTRGSAVTSAFSACSGSRPGRRLALVGSSGRSLRSRSPGPLRLSAGCWPPSSWPPWRSSTPSWARCSPRAEARAASPTMRSGAWPVRPSAGSPISRRRRSPRSRCSPPSSTCRPIPGPAASTTRTGGPSALRATWWPSCSWASSSR